MNGVVKQSLGYFRKNKANTAVICILTFLTSFMYFFVQCSIDKNKKLLNAKTALDDNDLMFRTALDSNSVLALVFLVILSIITLFIFYMFYKKKFDLERRNMGLLRSLGFTCSSITRIYMTISFVIGTVFTLIGMAAGYYFSYIILNNYKISCHVDYAQRGLSPLSFFMGVIVVSAVISLAALLASCSYKKSETSELLSGQTKEMENDFINRTAEKVSKIIISKYSFSSRLALRKPFNILLMLISVSIYLGMILISFSLNLSSEKIYTSLSDGRNYGYEIRLDETKTNEPDGCEFFVAETADISVDHKDIGEQEITAIDNGGKEFVLSDGKSQIALGDGEAAVSLRTADVYGVEKGDVITAVYSGREYSFTVKAIASNAAMNSVYVSRSCWNSMTGEPENAYNGIWCDDVPVISGEKSILTHDEYLAQLDDSNVSNRISAVINQVLGCVFGLLLIFLVLLLNFQDNSLNFVYLRKLGYLRFEIRKMLVNIYFPIMITAFIVVSVPTVFIAKGVLRMLSLQTGDYMPFTMSIPVFVYAFLVLLILYYAVLLMFDMKLKRTLKKIDNGDEV